MNFSEAKFKFDNIYKNRILLDKSIVTVDGKFVENISLGDINNEPNEEYYKWQFIYSLIQSGLYPRDTIGTEIYFPKGNISSAPIKIDAVIFDDLDWLDLYLEYRDNNNQDALDKLRSKILVVIEFKRDKNNKKIEQVFNSQIKASMKEPDCQFVLGIYYDKERLYLFKKKNEKISRLDNSKNFDNSQRILERLQLEITDAYHLIPSQTQLKKIIQGDFFYDLSRRKIEDLNIVFTINDEAIKQALSNILKSLDSVSLFNEEGYYILIQMLAIKIFDEKQADQYGSFLRFYITSEAYSFSNLKEEGINEYTNRIDSVFLEAKRYYKNILGESKIDWKNARHVRVASEITYQLQDFSFYKSRKSDLYQLVFYNFATKFKKDENAQFLTPIPIIKFLVDIVNPRRTETICDPCCGIGDFLSISYINSEAKLDDRNLYGFDNDYNMTVLAQLNMLLNGDGNAVIKYLPEKGSITQKIDINNNSVELDNNYHKSGNWDNWPDNTELLKYDVILTNPPFGKGRSLDLSKEQDKRAAELYELYDLYIKENPKAGLDLGVVFLENSIRSIKNGGRFGIVLSNSIASNNTWKFVREWLFKTIRLVALFDLPENVFAETGVNTTLIIGYKPKKSTDLKKLINANYSIFVREIKKVGYIKKTSQRNVIFEKDYKLNEETFETVIDENGESIANEDFSKVILEFKDWCVSQENELKKIFLD